MKLFIAFALISHMAFSHSNTKIRKTYGNVTVISSTYYISEHINKNLIIAQYAEMLCKKISYSDEVLIYLEQRRDNDTIKIFGKSRLNADTAKDINIYLPTQEIDILKCLNLIERSIIYRDELKKYSEDFASWYSSDISANVKEVLKNKIDRPSEVTELENPKSFTYYHQNGYYHIIARGFNCNAKEIGIHKEIYQLCELGPRNNLLCVFAAPNEIVIYEAECEYHSDIAGYLMGSSATNLKIDKADESYIHFGPYRIRELGKNNITFENLWRNNILLYSLTQKVFIQNLDEKIGK